MKYNNMILTTIVGLSLIACSEDNGADELTKLSLGNRLYHDTELSANRSMSCATCHSLDTAMIDPRETSMSLGASLGDDGVSIGDRNAPTAAYASFSPAFHFDEIEGLFIGGQFLDGRAGTLKEQAKGPFINPIEMGMPDIASVILRIKENSEYIRSFKTLYGNDVFESDENAYDALVDAISIFEQSESFNTFDSKYDRFLRGEYILSEAEARGLALFNNEEAGGAMCSACHPAVAQDDKPLFTDFSYDNLGVPVNHVLRTANGQAGNKDIGLYGNPAVDDVTLQGAFKVASLRNIAVTGPYMHNGLFKDLKTVVHFYNTRDVPGAINPETGAGWEEGEFHALRNTEELGNLGLSDQEEDDIVAFLKLLTDERYEHLIP